MVCRRVVFVVLSLLLSITSSVRAQEPVSTDLFRMDNLVAWCIVPFDGAKRGPLKFKSLRKVLGKKRELSQ